VEGYPARFHHLTSSTRAFAVSITMLAEVGLHDPVFGIIELTDFPSRFNAQANFAF
jgi:hypothetical protein